MATSVKPIRRASVTRVTSAGVYVTIPTIGPNSEIGPMDAGEFSLASGDRVIVGQAGNEQESWVVLTKLAPSPIGIPTPFIYSFATVADRDDIFDGVPANMISPTFAWVEDVKVLYVWTTTDDVWHQVSWDEDRVSAIEDYAILLDGRVDNLEAFAVTDSSTIDFTLSGVGAKTLTGVVKANSITLDDLSGVVVASPAAGQGIRYNGSAWVNDRYTADDLSDVAVSSPATGQTLRYNGSAFVNAKLATSDLSNVSGTPNPGDLLRWNGTAWVPVAKLQYSQVSDTANGSTTSTTYTATLTGASGLSTTFVASGTAAKITVTAHIYNGGGTGPFDFFFSFQVTGSGFSTYGPNDADAANMQGAVNTGGTSSATSVVTGLTPGTTYTVTAFHRCSSSTGNFYHRRIIVEY